PLLEYIVAFFPKTGFDNATLQQTVLVGSKTVVQYFLIPG
ncbi:unnamed protein product, partial [Didymodactylos carnosus]